MLIHAGVWLVGHYSYGLVVIMAGPCGKANAKDAKVRNVLRWLDVEFEEEDVAVFDNVLFAFGAE